ncbi:hypothetical protein IU450_28710 [Nocardia abscessus]|uniref:hypothetical protein n=1 Tax=Nocardia abscessus TaxID=120957 RepID=UPI001894381B|nr:hypothetical protein [Nocardia abscessus]MBF6339843.1 hypothetical protein [Nocardia abscessus]
MSPLQRNARHLYNVHYLLGDEQVLGALAALGLEGIAQLCADADEHSAAAGFNYTPRPAADFADSPLLADKHTGKVALELGYRRAMQLVYGSQPSMQDCLDSVRTHTHVL